jgi:hypothetical protein
MRARYFFIAFLLQLFGVTHAASDCQSIKEINSLIDGERCECGNGLDKYEHLKVNGYHLIAACFHEGYQKEAGQGQFFYKGDRLFKGRIEPNQIDVGLIFSDEEFNFYINSGKEVEKIEQLSGSAHACEYNVVAPANLRVKLFERVNTDSCQAGDRPLQYKIESVGKFSCKSP